jgi:hypothetical protein
MKKYPLEQVLTQLVNLVTHEVAIIEKNQACTKENLENAKIEHIKIGNVVEKNNWSYEFFVVYLVLINPF